jgi:hypothetical protein
MRSKTVLLLTVLVAVLVVNCSKFAIGGSETSGILTDAQLAPLVMDADDDLALSLRHQARAAMADLEAHRTF